MSYTELKCCRICGGTELIPTLELGIQAMAGTFPANVVEDAALTRGPLKLVRCAEASCGLVQLSCTYDLVEQYGDGYGYRSGLNKGMVKHLGEIAKHLDNDRRKFVLDIGSNDGTLLSKYSRDLNCYGKPGEFVGFDPTSKKFAKFYPPDVEKHAEFFTATAFRAAYGGACKADIVTAISMFYDLPDPQQFVHDVASILSDDGVFYFEQSYVGSVVERLAYDTVCHEHLEYYGIKQVALLLDRAGLRIIDVTFNDTNGGSFAVTAAHAASGHEGMDVTPLVALESVYLSDAAWKRFRSRVIQHRDTLFSEVRRLSLGGRVIHGLGASTKGNVLLQYCGLDTQWIEAIAEVNPDKFGHVTPGTCIPIVSEAESAAAKPDLYLVLPWHFRDGFLRRQTEDSPKLLFPLPEIEVCS